jgi:CHAT domain-containing protein
MKARALSDGIALAGSPTRRIVDRVSDPEALKYIEEEIELATRRIKCPAADRWTLRSEQKELHRRMVEHPDLQLYLQVRTGGVFPEELLSDFLAFPLAEGQSCVCVDWFELDGRYWLVTRSFGASSGYALEPTSVSVDAVTQLLQRIRTRGAHRDFYRFFADELRTFDSLVEPLRDLAQPEDLLVFIPTGHLHRLPLHALQVDGKTVLDRHPVAYTPSLTALGHCMARAQAPKLQTAAILANPTDDVPGADPIAHDLRSHLDADLYTGRAITRNRLLQAIQNVDLVHFHGHASFDDADPLESRLHVHDGAVRARDVFDVPGLQASHVTLAACETGTQDIDAGDEPLGLIPAFLTAGAGSVLATLWPVAATPTQAVITSFYDEVMRRDDALGTRSPLNRAEALRRAVLHVRETPGWEAPYYWAAFTLHGDWRSVGTSVV